MFLVLGLGFSHSWASTMDLWGGAVHEPSGGTEKVHCVEASLFAPIITQDRDLVGCVCCCSPSSTSNPCKWATMLCLLSSVLGPVAPPLELDALQTPALDSQSRRLISAQDLLNPTDLLLWHASVKISVIGLVQWGTCCAEKGVCRIS